MISVQAMSSIPVYSWIALYIVMIDDLHTQRENVLLCVQYQQCSCMTTRFDRCLQDGNVTPYKPPVNPSIIQPRWKCYIPELFDLFKIHKDIKVLLAAMDSNQDSEHVLYQTKHIFTKCFFPFGQGFSVTYLLQTIGLNIFIYFVLLKS